MRKLKPELINFSLYTLLLIVTPFLMLMNYLQTAVGMGARSALKIGDLSIPYLVILLAVAIILFLVFSVRKMNKIRIITLVIVIGLYILGQKTSDYYFGHKFYDLQYNWHFIAYGIFSYLAFRRFSTKKRPLYRIPQLTLLSSMLISGFDEFIQVFISGRVFDLSDIAKDTWGNMMGTFFIFFYMEKGKGFDNFNFRQKKFRNYFTNPFSLLCVEFIFSYVLLYISSNLTDTGYLLNTLIISVCITLLIIYLIHLGNNKNIKWILRGLGIVLLIYLGVAMFAVKQNVRYHSKGFVSYNSIPVIYFDCMIFPDGMIRLVDKKENFIIRDIQKLEDLNPDILLIATGYDGKGGKGWNDQEVTEMRYNINKHKVYQIIKMKTKEACAEYNRLVLDNKKVLFIIYNS
jgi:VanZ family protein